MKFLMYSIVILVSALIIYLNSRGIIENDTHVEEVVEEVLFHVLDTDIDLSPCDHAETDTSPSQIQEM